MEPLFTRTDYKDEAVFTLMLVKKHIFMNLRSTVCLLLKKSMDPNSFMYHLTYKGNIVGNEKCSKFRCVLYVYKFETTRHHKHDDPTQLDWLFPEYYSKTFRLSVKGFAFAFPSLSGSLKTFLSHHKI